MDMHHSTIPSDFPTTMKWKVIDRVLENLFLRMYARNLRRTYRSEPAYACVDAEIQVSTILLTAIGSIFLVIGGIYFPVVLRKIVNGSDAMYGTLIAVSVMVSCGVHWRFASFEKMSEAARQFISSSSSRRSSLIFWEALVGMLLIMIIVFARP